MICFVDFKFMYYQLRQEHLSTEQCMYFNSTLSLIKSNSRKKFGTLFWSVSSEVMHL